MGFFKALFLGILQGLTEFLPVSSSGHLKLAEYYLKVSESTGGSFDVFVHLGTLVAVMIYFRSTLWDMIQALMVWKPQVNQQKHRHNRLLIVYLIISTLVTGIIYLIFKDTLDSLFTNAKPMFVAFMLLITGVLLFISDYIKSTPIPAFSMGFIRSVIIGLGQGIAIIPGISRSGTTIAVSLMCGVKRKDAAHYSFLLSIPAIIAANLSVFKDIKALDKHMIFSYFVGFIASAIAGYAVIALLMNLIRQNKLKYFAFYCWAVGLIVILISVL
ncbi:MAG TPA: undecaprenyl-diphosphate phosphatase [Candidatus Cloacimonadota bacterium]|nr:undecaprenyl-diphosphate phosphatase [Candidatus Cloacimonadota bacterium]HPS37815.1 undecaprenyl-diphosphate phosphatase [Candidatus Cloacimonadota bacterium]